MLSIILLKPFRNYYGFYLLFYYDYRFVSRIRGCHIKLLLGSNIFLRFENKKHKQNLLAGSIRTRTRDIQNTKCLNKRGRIYSSYLDIIFITTIIVLNHTNFYIMGKCGVSLKVSTSSHVSSSARSCHSVIPILIPISI